MLASNTSCKTSLVSEPVQSREISGFKIARSHATVAISCVWFQSLSRSRVVPCHTGTSTFWQPVSKADLGFIKTATDVFDTLKRSRDLGSHGHSDARITRNTSTRKSETASPQEVAQIRKISGLLVPSKCVTLAPGSRVAGCKTVLVSKRRFENFLPLMNSVVYARNDNNDWR